MDNKLPFYRGCLLGLAIGDAMGYTVDKKNYEEICRDYGPNGLLGFDLQHEYAEVTSYTQLAVFVANGLLAGATRGRPDSYSRYIATALREWTRSQQYRSSSEKTLCWVAQIPALRRRLCMDTRMLDTLTRETLGTPEHPCNPFTSPGALTCAVAPGLFFSPERIEPQQIGRLAAEAVAMSHGDPETFLSGAVLAYSIAGILQDPSHTLPNQFTQAMDAVRGQFGEQFPQVSAVSAQLDKAVRLAKTSQITPQEAMQLLGCTTASECLAGAVYICLVHPGNFDEAVIAAVNHSGRSSAVGALVGAILGARLGEDALPEFYLESLEPADALRELAEDIAQGRQLSRIFDDSWDQKYVQGMPLQ